jgi:hypothetical protein
MRPILPLLLSLVALHTPLCAQIVVGQLGPETDVEWNDIWVDPAAGKLFLSDATSARLRVYDARSLAPLPDVDLSPYLPKQPRQLAGHVESGTLYVAVDAGFATSPTTIVAVDTATGTVSDDIDGLGLGLFIAVDEPRDLLYVMGRNGFLVETLTAINVATNMVVDDLDLESVMGFGLLSWGGVNEATGAILITNLHTDEFAVVTPPPLVGSAFAIASSRGWTGAWNPRENTAYITTITWGGYFHFDLDNASSAVTSCVNDGTSLFYSAATNRIYSGAEVNGDTTVIAGGTSSCQNIEVGGGLADVGFLGGSLHAFFAGAGGTVVLDEVTLHTSASFPSCGPCGGGGVVGGGVAVDPTRSRVFVRHFCDTTEGMGSCVVVIQDALFRDGFELDGTTGHWSGTSG